MVKFSSNSPQDRLALISAGIEGYTSLLVIAEALSAFVTFADGRVE